MAVLVPAPDNQRPTRPETPDELVVSRTSYQIFQLLVAKSEELVKRTVETGWSGACAREIASEFTHAAGL